jgi:methionyl-tRNA synthetase
MLMAADVEVPRQVYAHGFLLVGGEKMGKSNATGIRPAELVEHFGVDCYRYYFLREISFGQDGSFSWESMEQRYTTDLANDLGNLANRTLNMVSSYCGGQLPEPTGERGDAERALEADLATALAGMAGIDSLEFKRALEDLWVFVSGVNRYIEVRAPWKLNKQGATDDLARSLYTAVDALRIIAVLVSPVMPVAAQRLWDKLGLGVALEDQRLPAAASWGGTPAGVRVDRGDLLFPKLAETAEEPPPTG